MNEQSLKALKKYLTFVPPVSPVMLLLAGAIWLGCVYMVVFVASKEDRMLTFALLAMILLFGILLFGSIVKPRIEIGKKIEKATRPYPSDDITQDFEAATTFGKDDIVRAGDKYIYGKHAGQPVRYTDIRYLKIVSVTGVGLAYISLVGYLRSGRTAIICIKRTRKEPPQSMLDAAGFIMYKNPDVKFTDN